MDRLEIRSAQAGDSATVVGWFGDRMAARTWAGPSTPDPLTPDWLAARIAEPGFVHRTAVDAAGGIVGFYGVHLSPAKRRGHVMRVAVAPSQRRKGLGAHLLEDAVTTARGRGLSRLTLFVYGSNPPARALYERLGWVDAESVTAPEDPSGFKQLMRFDIEPR